MSNLERLAQERERAFAKVADNDLARDLHQGTMLCISSAFFGPRVDPGGLLEAFCDADSAWRRERTLHRFHM